MSASHPNDPRHPTRTFLVRRPEPHIAEALAAVEVLEIGLSRLVSAYLDMAVAKDARRATLDPIIENLTGTTLRTVRGRLETYLPSNAEVV